MALNNILKAEAASATFRKLKRYAKGEHRTALQRVEVPILDSNSKPTGVNISVTNPSELYTAITNQNILHFSQAMDTPGVSGRLGHTIPPFTQNVHSTSIIQGTFDLSEIDPLPEIQYFLQAMAKPSALHSSSLVDTIITTQDFQQGFKKLSNRTSLSPSGHYITHYKILATDPELSQILARAITMPLTYGFSLARWRIAVQFMLEKEEGNPIIIKLRVIQLLEADMNFAFRLIWGKRLVHNALAHNVLSQWNFGGRPGARVHSALFLTISYEHLRFTWYNAIIFDNDAKACFDRIIPSLGLMATERLGMPQQATTSVLATMKGMHFFIRTAHGISPGFYTSTAAALILGVLQGSRAAPCIWISLSCILLHALQSHTSGFQATCPRNTRTSQCPGKVYIDNTDLWLKGISPSTPSTTLTSFIMQGVALVWECLLFASRGALAFQKCFYFLVHW